MPVDSCQSASISGHLPIFFPQWTAANLYLPVESCQSSSSSFSFHYASTSTDLIICPSVGSFWSISTDCCQFSFAIGQLPICAYRCTAVNIPLPEDSCQFASTSGQLPICISQWTASNLLLPVDSCQSDCAQPRRPKPSYALQQ